MNVTAKEPIQRTIPRADFGRVTVFFGEKNGKYPDANQVIVRGTDTQAAFDTPIMRLDVPGPPPPPVDLGPSAPVHRRHCS